MAGHDEHQQVRARLLEILGRALEGLEVEVGDSPRWKRTVLTFRHPVFAGWLPEQRFRRLLQLIPPEFFQEHLRGAVWFELAPGETEDDLLRAKRSEDVAPDEPRISRKLLKTGFYEALAEGMGPSPIESCGGDFAAARKVLAEIGILDGEQRDACLVFIRNGAYCDCEVLLAAKPALLEKHGGGRNSE